jgi:hypothetical protein
MGKLKIPIREAPILLLHKNIEVRANFTFFVEIAGEIGGALQETTKSTRAQIICEGTLINYLTYDGSIKPS